VLTVKACGSPGVWRMGALGGLAGIDWPSLMIVHGDDATWPQIRAYARFYEAGAVKGAAEKAARDRAAPDEGGGAAEPGEYTEVQHG